jgi:hypothetical protein
MKLRNLVFLVASLFVIGTIALANVYTSGIPNPLTTALGGTGITTNPTPGALVFGATASTQGYTAAGTTAQIIQSAGAGTPTWTSTPGSGAAFTSITANHHLSGGSTPGIAAGAGGDATATVSMTTGSTDYDGQISVVAAGTPSANAVICTVTFATTYTTQPFVVFCPSNINSELLATDIYVNTAAGSFTMNVGSVALSAGTTYLWQYHVAH